MVRAWHVVLLIILVSVPASGQETVPLERETIRRIEAVFRTWNRSDGPGGAVGIIAEGRLIYARGFGKANLEHDIQNSSSTVFRIGSTSKQFTAMCVLLLAQRKNIDLGDPIGKYFPEMQPAMASVVIWQLLHHTSGIPDYLALHALAGSRRDDWYTPKDSLAMIARQSRIMFEPGSRFSYSNSNFLLLGDLVRRISGKSLKEFAQEHIFKPLGMTSTHFHDDHGHVVKGRAHGYAWSERGWRLANTTLDHVGDGGVFTTVQDLLKWDRVFYQNPLDGGAELIRTLLKTAPGSGGYACGIGVDPYRGLEMQAHGGAFVGFRAEMIRFPSERISIICLANFAAASPSRRAREVADIILAGKLGKQKKRPGRGPGPGRRQPTGKRPDAAGLASYAGRFSNGELPAIYTVAVSGEGLKLSVGHMTLHGRPLGGDHFDAGSTRVRFDRDERGAVVALAIKISRTGEIVFEKVRSAK